MYYVLDYVLVDTIMLLAFASIKIMILFEYPFVDSNALSNIGFTWILIFKSRFLSGQKYHVYE